MDSFLTRWQVEYLGGSANCCSWEQWLDKNIEQEEMESDHSPTQKTQSQDHLEPLEETMLIRDQEIQRPSDSLEREALATAPAQQHHSSSAPRRLHMKILWIPHMPWQALMGQRERHLLDSWPDSDDELHILTWQAAQGYGSPLSSLGWSTFPQGRTTGHTRPRIPNVMGRFTKNYARGLWANEQLFRFYTKQLVHSLGVDVLVYGRGHYAVGLPPFDLPIPKVFDYMDLITYPNVEAEY